MYLVAPCTYAISGHYNLKMVMKSSICWLWTGSLETASCILEPFSRRNHTSRGLGEVDGSWAISRKLLSLLGSVSHESNRTQLPSLISIRMLLTSFQAVLSSILVLLVLLSLAFLDHMSVTMSTTCATDAMLATMVKSSGHPPADPGLTDTCILSFKPTPASASV